MLIVYTWDAITGDGKQKESVGHASMTISFEGDTGRFEDYVSWWPINDVWEGKAIPGRELINDVADESRPASHIYTFVNIFDDQAALNAWKKWKEDRAYRLITRNCSTTVLRCLEAAGLKNYTTYVDFPPVTPDFVRGVCAGVVEKLSRYKKLYMKPGMFVSGF